MVYDGHWHQNCALGSFDFQVPLADGPMHLSLDTMVRSHALNETTLVAVVKILFLKPQFLFARTAHGGEQKPIPVWASEGTKNKYYGQTERYEGDIKMRAGNWGINGPAVPVPRDNQGCANACELSLIHI